jgi:hypothetical protein
MRVMPLFPIVTHHQSSFSPTLPNPTPPCPKRLHPSLQYSAYSHAGAAATTSTGQQPQPPLPTQLCGTQSLRLCLGLTSFVLRRPWELVHRAAYQEDPALDEGQPHNRDRPVSTTTPRPRPTQKPDSSTAGRTVCALNHHRWRMCPTYMCPCMAGLLAM